VVSDPTAPRPRRRGQGFWLTAGEIIGVLALIVAALNAWDNYRQHQEAVREAAGEARAQAALVAVGEADPHGRQIIISALKPSQAIQSVRFWFPKAVLDHPMQITAARPRIETGSIDGGLRHVLAAAHAPRSGDATLPVAIETTFVEDGETRRDTSLYRIAFSWKPRLFGTAVSLAGIALDTRGLHGDAQASVEARWRADSTLLKTR